MTELVFVGRPGQPVAELAELVAAAALLDGKYSQTYRLFGLAPLRQPVTAVTRIATGYIRERGGMRVAPDYLVVVDPTLWQYGDLTKGMEPGGAVIVGTDGRVPRLEAGDRPVHAFPVPADKTLSELPGLFLQEIARATGAISTAAVERVLAGHFGFAISVKQSGPNGGGA